MVFSTALYCSLSKICANFAMQQHKGPLDGYEGDVLHPVLGYGWNNV